MTGTQPALTIDVNGKRYTMRTSEMTARDSALLRKQTGMSARLLLAAAAKDPDLDVVAAIVWLARRQAGEADVTFDEVAAEIGYDLDIQQVDDESEDEESDGPEV